MLSTFAVCALSALLALGTTTNTPSIRKAPYAGTWPDQGSLDPSVPFQTQGSGTQVGTLRTGDRTYAMTFPSAYGQRATFTRSFDLTEKFTVSFNFSDMAQNHTGLLMFSTSKQDPYIDGNGAYLSMDLVRSPLDGANYCLTLSTGAHNTSITGTEWPTTAWSGNSAYTGLELTGVSDGEISLTFQSSGDNEIVTVNANSYTIPKSTLFAAFPAGSDLSQIYVASGVMNGSPSLLDHVVISNLGDAKDEVYYGASGNYTIQKGYVTSLADAVADGLETIEKLNAAKAIRSKIDLTSLYSYDQTYLKGSYDASSSAIDAATIALGNDAVIADYKDAVVAFKTAVASDMTLETNVDSAIAKSQEALTRKDAVTALTGLTDEQNSEIEAADAEYQAAYETLQAAAALLYRNSVSAYVSACTDLSSGTAVAEALRLKNLILSKYASYLSEDEQAAESEKIASGTALLAKCQAPSEGWLLGQRGYTVRSEDAMSYVSAGTLWGDSQLDVVKTNALIYQKEKLSSSHFSMTIDVAKWSKTDGAWMSIGIMEHPGYFSTAEDDSVQNNKGVFFLLRANVGQSLINVDAYVNTLTCNRFFDAELPTKMDIPFDKTLSISFEEEETTISGVTETYWVPSFNGHKMDTDHVKATKIKTALANKEGYLYIGTNGTDESDPFVMNITEINGNNPFAASLRKAEEPAHEAPTSSATSTNYTISSNEDLKISLDTKGEAITKLTLGGKELTKEQYSYDEGTKTLTVKANALSGVTSAGNQQLVVTTAGGSLTITIAFQAAAPKKKSKGCGGTVVGSAFLGVAALAGACALLFYRRKKD